MGEGQEGEGGRPISSCASIMSYIENLCRKGRVVRGGGVCVREIERGREREREGWRDRKRE